jgi:hypothetical protein
MIQINIPDTLQETLASLSEDKRRELTEAFRRGGERFVAGIAAGLNEKWRPPVNTWYPPSSFSSVRDLRNRMP